MLSDSDRPTKRKRFNVDHDDTTINIDSNATLQLANSAAHQHDTSDGSTSPTRRRNMTTHQVETTRVPLPQDYLTSTICQTPQFQQPLHLTSFSYSKTRQLLFESDIKDSSLNVLTKHRLRPDHVLNLNQGFEECVWRDSTVDEGLDALLLTLDEWDKRDKTGFATDCLLRNKILTWRGMMTKLMLSSYQVTELNRDRRGQQQDDKGWEMNAMMIDGTLYLEDSNSPTKLAAKATSEQSSQRFAYHGIAFESFLTRPISSTLTTTDDEFEPPNTNIQWCSVVKTNLGGHRMILGGEVDCINNDKNKIETNNFIELKTNMIIKNERDEINFEKNKLMKHFAQSFLLGVPKVIVGFRDRQGLLQTVQDFNTLDLPRLVRGKPHAWDKRVLLSSATDILTFLTNTLSHNPIVIDKEKQLFQIIESRTKSSDSNDTNEIEQNKDETLNKVFEDWPVFQIKFDPTGFVQNDSIMNSKARLNGGSISIVQLSNQQIQDQVLGAKRFPLLSRLDHVLKQELESQERVGFLLRLWVDGVVRRRMNLMIKERAAPPVQDHTRGGTTNDLAQGHGYVQAPTRTASRLNR
ncbi:decapping endonuclease targeting mRNA [Microbotryomycetes sp. JL221]|nr:decapping endonuclease targeting mRNA [Microbotryomycetes sp. JL221]